ncbi:hypothetical protein BB559_007261 [Furculomyces boomerangus]|uniref:Uncharacterized protein n=1 Tax=Furculomyces boomerangus TaxID=61424 RepID=A0A2T9XY54_9FUNG|nr:hypothetical protein BB559_007261 [Furculomyces boomerangus]
MMFTKSIVFLTLASVCLSSPVPRQPENDGIAEKSQNLQRDSGIDSLENPDLVADFLKNTGSFIEENKVKKKGNKGGKKGIKGKKSVPKNRKNIHKRNHGLGKGKKIGFSTESEDFLIQQAVTDAFANIFDSIISLLNNHKKDSDIDDQENNDIDD